MEFRGLNCLAFLSSELDAGLECGRTKKPRHELRRPAVDGSVSERVGISVNEGVRRDV